MEVENQRLLKEVMYIMLITNILLGIIIFLLIIIFGGITNVDRKLLSNAEYLRLKMLSESSMVKGRKVKDEKERP